MMSWSYTHNFPNDVRMEIGIDLCAFMVGIAWSRQDFVVRAVCLFVAFDWFDE